MAWEVIYHPKVKEDLDSIGKAEARRILKVIEERIVNGSPGQTDKPLAGNLSGCRRIRTGSNRIIYKIENEKIKVLVRAVDPRCNREVYDTASKRLS